MTDTVFIMAATFCSGCSIGITATMFFCVRPWQQTSEHWQALAQRVIRERAR